MPFWVDWLTRELPTPPGSLPPSTVFTGVLGFYVGAGNLACGPYSCAGSTLPNEPSHCPLIANFLLMLTSSCFSAKPLQTSPQCPSAEWSSGSSAPAFQCLSDHVSRLQVDRNLSPTEVPVAPLCKCCCFFLDPEGSRGKTGKKSLSRGTGKRKDTKA